MPFGLRNAGQSFQRFMDEVLAGLDFAFCYLDDILIASSSEDEHLQHLQQVLQWLQQYGLVLNMEKCELGRQQVDFLGHRITAEGAAPITRHVEAVQNFSRPQDKKQLQSFLGLVNFYRRFIPAAARISSLSQTRCGRTKTGCGCRPCSTPSSSSRHSDFSSGPGSSRPGGGGEPGGRCQQNAHQSSSAAAGRRRRLETAGIF